MNQPPQANPAEIYRALSTILLPGQVTELRAIRAIERGWRSPHVISGYFNNIDAMVRAASQIQAKGIYFIPNQIHPALLARAANRIRGLSRGEPTTSDDKVIRRLWLLVDADPVRPDSHISASMREHQFALKRANEIRNHLAKEGWPDPIWASSGNGGHLLYAISQTTDDGGLVQDCLAALGMLFSDHVVTIDQTVFNPARIWKLYGTVARKGDHTHERPHRLAHLIDVPETIQLVPHQQLEELAAKAQKEDIPTVKPRTANRRQETYVLNHDFNVEEWLSEAAIEVSKSGGWSGRNGQGYRWELARCPYNPSHFRSAYIVQHPNGGISAGCHHNGCKTQGWGWKELRSRFDSHYAKHQARRRPQNIHKSKANIYNLLAQLIEACGQLSPSERQMICESLRTEHTEKF